MNRDAFLKANREYSSIIFTKLKIIGHEFLNLETEHDIFKQVILISTKLQLLF